VFKHPGPRALFAMLLLLSALAAPLQRMLPLFVADVFRAGETSYGLLLGLFGAGAVLGGLTLGRWPRWYPRHHLIPFALTLTGVCMTMFCTTHSLAVGGVWIAAAGTVWIWAFSSTMTALQLLVGDTMRGRVLSVINMAMFGAMPIGSLAAALLGERLVGLIPGAAPVQLGVGVMAVLLTLCGVLLLVFRTPEIDEATPTTPRRPHPLVRPHRQRTPPALTPCSYCSSASRSSRVSEAAASAPVNAASASARLRPCSSRIRPSTVSSATSRCTITGRVCPMRCARSAA
jgi:MFS family permease